METNINIGSSQAFRLQRAVLIYGTAEHRSGFATVHEVQRPSAEANPRLGPATLVTTEFVRELIKGLGRNTCLEMLPENILARNEFVTAWLSLCKLNGVKLCTLFGVSPRQQSRDGGRVDFE